MRNTGLIDIGVNLTNQRFEKDFDDVLSRAEAANICGMLVTGTNVRESQSALELAKKHPHILASTAGVHPHDADNVSEDYLLQLKHLASFSQVRAIGECGLDFNRNFSTPENQQRVFKEQVELAVELNMPLFLHQRDAFAPWFEILSPHLANLPAAVTHCFTGNEQELLQCLDAGMYVGITGWLCDERRGQELRDIVKHIPLSRLMIETDAPYLTPRTIRPKPKSSRNEPAYLPYVVQALVETTGYSEADIINHSRENAARVFNFV